MRKEIWDLIIAHCKKHGISRYKLAMLSRMPNRTIYRCDEDSFPKLEQLAEIASSVGLTLEIRVTEDPDWQPPVDVH